MAALQVFGVLPNATHIAVAIGGAFHLSRGFGARKSKSEDDDVSRSVFKRAKGKLVGCATCGSTGKKACQFCQGTKLMVGFLGKRVKCVPCQGTGTLGRPCPDCNGMGFLSL